MVWDFVSLRYRTSLHNKQALMMLGNLQCWVTCSQVAGPEVNVHEGCLTGRYRVCLIGQTYHLALLSDQSIYSNTRPSPASLKYHIYDLPTYTFTTLFIIHPNASSLTIRNMFSQLRVALTSRYRKFRNRPQKQHLTTTHTKLSSHTGLHHQSADNPPAGPVSPGSAADSAVDPMSSNTIPVPVTTASSANLERDRQSKSTRLSWDRAYDLLRQENEELITEYENLLAMELGAENGAYNSSASNGQIDKADNKLREAQLKTLVDRGLRRSEEAHTSYTIFGQTFTPRKQLAQTATFVQSLKTFVDEAVKASPEASLAWAGVCTILPILINPLTADTDQREGFAYVTSRMSFYVELERDVWPKSQGLNETTKLKGEFMNNLIRLYNYFLEFQIKVVVRLYDTRSGRLKDDVFHHKDWKEMTDKVKGLEAIIRGDLRMVNDVSLRMQLEQLNKTADQFLKTYTSAMSASTGAGKEQFTNSFVHSGNGNQFNATKGSIQYNHTGSGSQNIT
ncbi:Sophorolipid transporter [Fusarium oxysporum f. sp. albedinis]|nr:Sophorolipid transporter [Fusarium oxysporum f. sp. albedinis]